MKKILATLFIVVLMLGASLSAITVAATSPDEEEEEGPGDTTAIGSEDEDETVGDKEDEEGISGEEGDSEENEDEGSDDGDDNDDEDREEENEDSDDLNDDDEEDEDETEHSHEEEDEEEDEELGSHEDEEGDLIVTSSDNTIEFNAGEPRISFEYTFTNGTGVEFEAKDFALTEFNSSMILQRLEFAHIPWNLNYTVEAVGNNTIITVTYYANTTEYEITLIMYVYQRRMNSTVNANVVFSVDGGADEVKFDLNVTRWTWVSNSSQLSLFMEVESEAEGKVSSASASVNEDRVTINLTDIGIDIGWVKQATITWPNGTSELVDVTVTYESWELEGEGEEVELELEIYFTYPYFGQGQLFHDPSIGIEDDPVVFVLPPPFTFITPEILIGTGVTALVILATAVAVARRRKLSLERTAPPL